MSTEQGSRRALHSALTFRIEQRWAALEAQAEAHIAAHSDTAHRVCIHLRQRHK